MRALRFTIVLWAAGACALQTNAPAPEEPVQELFSTLPDTGLVLRAMARRPVVARGEPAEIVVTIVNGSTPSLFMNDPDQLGIWLENEDGAAVEVVDGFATTGSWGEVVQLVLPARAMLTQVYDLRCLRSGYETRAGSPCGMVYDLSEPGRYRAIVRYSGPAYGRFARPPMVDTVFVTVR